MSQKRSFFYKKPLISTFFLLYVAGEAIIFIAPFRSKPYRAKGIG